MPETTRTFPAAMHPSLWQILLLAVVQGITEFLPVSSSGHLVILAAVLSPGTTRAFEVSDVSIVLHVGTLLAILVFYWRRVCRLIGEDRRLLPLLAIGTLPAVALGLPLKFFCEPVLEDPLVAGCLLVVTGVLLIWVGRLKPRSEDYARMNVLQSLLIGVSQAAAILPGLSRSGATISAGLYLGLSRSSAATFSFLLAIPAIAGAGVLEVAMHVRESTSTTPATSLAAGVAVSFLVGLGSLWWLVRWLEQGRLQWFAWWCIPLGVAVIGSYVLT